MWQNGIVEFKFIPRYQIQFEGVRGNGTRGNIVRTNITKSLIHNEFVFLILKKLKT